MTKEEVEQKFLALVDLYRKMSEVRKRCLENSAIIQSYLERGEWFPLEQKGHFVEALESLCSTQEKLCSALSAVGISASGTVDDVSARVKEWHAQQSQLSEERTLLVKQLEKIARICYKGSNEKAQKGLEEIKSQVSSLLEKSLSFEELSAQAAKYLNFLQAVEADGLAEKELTQGLLRDFGQDVFFACLYKEYSVSAPEKTVEPASVPPVKPELQDLSSMTSTQKIATDAFPGMSSVFGAECIVADAAAPCRFKSKSSKAFMSFLQNKMGRSIYGAMQLLKPLLTGLFIFDRGLPQFAAVEEGVSVKSSEEQRTFYEKLVEEGVIQKLHLRGLSFFALSKESETLFRQEFVQSRLSIRVSRGNPSAFYFYDESPENGVAYTVRFYFSAFVAALMQNSSYSDMQAGIGWNRNIVEVKLSKSKDKFPDTKLRVFVPRFSTKILAEQVHAVQELQKQRMPVLVVACNVKEAKQWLAYFPVASAYVFSEKEKNTPVLTQDGKFVSLSDALMLLAVAAHDKQTPTVAPAAPKSPVAKAPSKKAEKETMPSRKVVAHTKKESVMKPTARKLSEQDVSRIKQDLELVNDLFEKGEKAEGMLLLHALRQEFDDENLTLLCSEIGYAVYDPLYDGGADPDGFKFLDSMFSFEGMHTDKAMDYLNAAALLRTFYRPSNPMDFRLKTDWNRINEEESNQAYKAVPELKQLMRLFYLFTEKHSVPFAICVQGLSSQHEELQRREKNIRKELDDQILALKNEVKKPSGHVRTKTLCDKLYGNDGTVIRYLEQVDSVSLQELAEFCGQFTKNPQQGWPELQDLTDDVVDSKKVEAYLDEIWMGVDVRLKRNAHFIGKDLAVQTNHLKKAVYVLICYIALRHAQEQDQNRSQVKYETMEGQRVDAVNLLNEIGRKLSSISGENCMESIAIQCLRSLVAQLTDKLSGQVQSTPFYAEFLRTNFVELNQDMLPDLETVVDIDTYSLRQRCQQHIAQKTRMRDAGTLTWENAFENAVQRYNLGAAQQIVPFLDASEQDKKSEQIHGLSDYLDKRFEDATVTFRGNVELKANYGCIGDTEQMEKYIVLADVLQSHFRETKNYGMYDLFLHACMEDIDEKAKPRKKHMQEQLDQFLRALAGQRPENDAAAVKADNLFRKQIQALLDRGNLTVVEDYLHRCTGKGYAEVQKIMQQSPGAETAVLNDYLSSYQTYYDCCVTHKKSVMKNVYESWKREQRNRFQNRRSKEADSFMEVWTQLATLGDESNKVAGFLEALSFDLDADNTKVAYKKAATNCVVYKVNMRRSAGHRTAYAHPFAAFGSFLYRNQQLTLLVYSGYHTVEALMSDLAKHPVSSGSMIVLMDSAQAAADRREMARRMKMESRENTLVMDRVLALYLTQFENAERGVRLLQCALPFAFVQPYVTQATIPPEMFIGRTQELKDIEDMRGPVLVYGGRQLGKSALLHQACFRTNRPENGEYALFLDIKSLSCGDALRSICAELERIHLLKQKEVNRGDFNSPDAWPAFEQVMRKVLMPGNSSVKALRLFLDEADAFLASAEQMQNRPIEVLKKLKDYSEGTFKFVLAGLHNVLRFDRKQLGGNTVLTQLGHIVIKPFSYLEASELLLKPLGYLGFEIPQEEGKPTQSDIVSMILSKANYFPGLIQYYGHKLVEAVKQNYQTNTFQTVNNPPYPLDENYLKGLLGDEDFKDQISEKFMITLELDEDKYYAIIAHVVAYFYYMYEKPTPITANDVLDVCDSYKIHKMSGMKVEKVQALIDEMVDLNILHKGEGGAGYIFNRYNFYMMMGSEEDVERDLNEYSEETGHV